MFPTANGECSTSCRPKVRFAIFSCYILLIIRQSNQLLCPVFSHKVFFRGDYYIGYVNTFRYKHDVNNNSNIDHWCNLREREKYGNLAESKPPGLKRDALVVHVLDACPRVTMYQDVFIYIKFQKSMSRLDFVYQDLHTRKTRFLYTNQDLRTSIKIRLRVHQVY